MREWILVALGGASGACARFGLSGFVLHRSVHGSFPFGTFVVNVLGCLLAGLLVGLAEKHHLLAPEVRVFLLTGLLGGFTTFSAFGVETVHLMRRGEYLVAGTYVSLSLLCGLLALWLAYWVIPLRR